MPGLIGRGPAERYFGAPARRGPDRRPSATLGGALRYGAPEAEPRLVDVGQVESGTSVADGNPQAARIPGVRAGRGATDTDPGLSGPGVRRHVRQGLTDGVRHRGADPGRDGRRGRVLDGEVNDQPAGAHVGDDA